MANDESPATHGTSRLGWLALIPAAILLLAWWATAGGERIVVAAWPWIPSLGISLAFRIDGLALQFILLIAGIGTLVFVYAAGYMAGVKQRLRLFGALVAFMLAMLGTVSADNLLLLFVFWEMTSLTSFLLVGFKHEKAAARRSAQQALMVTAGGGLVMLAGFVMLGAIAGTYSISGLLASAPAWLDHPALPLALGCVLVGAFAKSAQMPFHFWLPNAMAAPTPVSAYLHSATMVKLGVYLMARLDPALHELALWQWLLVGFGGLTAAWSMLLALRERDLKRILAWSTVSALGTLTMLIGLPGTVAPGAMAAFLLAHALYKAPLFFVAGNVDHCTGSRSIDDLAGLAPHMPWTAAAAAIAAVSMAGLPFSLGYFAKHLIDIARAEGGVFVWVGYASLAVGAVSVAVAAVAAVRIFWHRNGRPVPAQIHEAGWAMRLPPLLVGGVGLVFGLQPEWLAPLLDHSAVAMGGVPPSTVIGVGTIGLDGMTGVVATLGAGIAIYLGWDRLHRTLERGFPLIDRVGMVAHYERMLKAIPVLAGWTTRHLQGGRASAYTLLAAGSMGLALAVAALLLAPPAASAPALPAGTAPALVAIALGAVAALFVRSSLLLLLASGLVGFGSAGVFLFVGAPDLAFTQFTVEVAFIVILVAVLLRTGATRESVAVPRQRLHELARASIATGGGLLAAWMVLAGLSGPADRALSDYFAATAVPEAYGRNVVNVILVDFRAVDTMGEIAVVAAAFLAVLPLLLALKRGKKETTR
jgi:multicomponent Na+:H+ antiporter subunit A